MFLIINQAASGQAQQELLRQLASFAETISPHTVRVILGLGKVESGFYKEDSADGLLEQLSTITAHYSTQFRSDPAYSGYGTKGYRDGLIEVLGLKHGVSLTAYVRATTMEQAHSTQINFQQTISSLIDTIDWGKPQSTTQGLEVRGGLKKTPEGLVSTSFRLAIRCGSLLISKALAGQFECDMKAQVQQCFVR